MNVKETTYWDGVLNKQEDELRDSRRATRVLLNAPPVSRLKIARLQLFNRVLGVHVKFWRNDTLWYF